MLKEPRNAAIIHTEADSLCDDIRALGWNPIPCPVLSIVPMHYDRTLVAQTDYTLITSVHAIPSALRAGLPVIAVGARTAQMARDAGLAVLPYPLTQACDLLSITERLTPYKILHLSGAHLSPDTPAIMGQLGISSVVVYEAVPVSALPPAIETSLNEGILGAVLLFSARSAHVFTDLANRATNKDLWQNVHGVALSPSVAHAMASVSFASIKIASAPHRNSILEALGHEQFS